MAATDRFDVPPEMRAFAEKSVEQAKEAFEVFISAAEQAVNAAETQAASARAGAKEIGELAIGYAERNIGSSFDFAQRLMRAKDPNDVLMLHSDYVNGQLATLANQARELSKCAANLAGPKQTAMR
jgi:phasin